MLSTILISLTISTAAAADDNDISAGGVVVHPAWLTDVGEGWSPGLMDCIGGTGLAVKERLRTGGEGHLCLNDRSAMGLGGGSVGAAIHPGPWFLSATGTGGLGWLGIEEGLQDWAATFLYVKPTLSAGLGFGWFGAELGLQTSVGFPIYQWQPAVDDWRPFVYGGAQLSLLFGEFWPREPRRRVGTVDRPARRQPMAIPAATPEPPMPASELEREQLAKATREQRPTSELDRARVALEQAANDLQSQIDATLARTRAAEGPSTAEQDALRAAAAALQVAADTLNEMERDLERQLESAQEPPLQQ